MLFDCLEESHVLVVRHCVELPAFYESFLELLSLEVRTVLADNLWLCQFDLHSFLVYKFHSDSRYYGSIAELNVLFQLPSPIRAPVDHKMLVSVASPIVDH